MKFGVIGMAALLALSLVACSKSTAPSGGTEATVAPATTAAETMAPAGGMMAKTHMKGVSVTMNAQNGSGESGTATLTANGAKTLVVVSLTGEPAAGSQPAHIHPGSCAKLNPIPKYALSPVVGGKSTTTVNEKLAEMTTGHWAINVHDSATNLKKYVSCGDIPAAGMMKPKM